jgi:pimeloyl-ACP methyl ester carboxylesterase
MSSEVAGVERVNGVGIAYCRWSAPRAPVHPPVVLLHGVLQSSEGMRHLADLLADCGEVLVPDLRGRGKSDRPADGYDPGTMADDVAALIERLGIEQPCLIGRLHGGLIAYYLAARRPELVSALVLGDTNPQVNADRAARALSAVQAMPPGFASRDDAIRFYEERLGLSRARAEHDIPSDLEQLEDGSLRWRHDLKLVQRIESASMPRSDWEVLAGVRCPVLILRGQRGEIRPETATRMLEVIPNAQAQVIFGSGHDVFLGPGSEQSLAALQLFLRGQGNLDR